MYYSAVELFDIVGPSARSCFMITLKSESQMPTTLNITAANFLNALFALKGELSEGAERSGFYEFFFVSAKDPRQRLVSRKLQLQHFITISPATEYHRTCLGDWILQLSYDEVARFGELLSSSPSTKGLWDEGFAIMSALKREKTLDVYKSVPKNVNDDVIRHLKFDGMHVADLPHAVPKGENVPQFSPKNKTLYKTETNAATLDFLWYDENGPLMIQVTLASTHKMSQKGFDHCKQIFKTRQDLPFAFLVPDKERGRKLCNQKKAKKLNAHYIVLPLPDTISERLLKLQPTDASGSDVESADEDTEQPKRTKRKRNLETSAESATKKSNAPRNKVSSQNQKHTGRQSKL